MTNPDRKILQIIPANHWWGKYKDEEPNKFFYRRASCWALIHEKCDTKGGKWEDTYISLMDADQHGCIEEMCQGSNFEEIIYSEKDLNES